MQLEISEKFSSGTKISIQTNKKYTASEASVPAFTQTMHTFLVLLRRALTKNIFPSYLESRHIEEVRIFKYMLICRCTLRG